MFFTQTTTIYTVASQVARTCMNPHPDDNFCMSGTITSMKKWNDPNKVNKDTLKIEIKKRKEYQIYSGPFLRQSVVLHQNTISKIQI
jgi:hypothetical protein